MGLKDWLGKNVAGVSGYGAVIGREAVKNGIALGRMLYLGHGTRSTASDMFIFEDDNHMKSEGFELYCPDRRRKPPEEDSSELSKQTRAVGIALAVRLALTAASNFFQKANCQDFNRAMGSSNGTELRERNLGFTLDEVLYYLKLPVATKVTKVVNLQMPGTDDLMAVFLEDVSKHHRNGFVGFQRTGMLGFDVTAVPLAEQTSLKIREASQKFGW